MSAAASRLASRLPFLSATLLATAGLVFATGCEENKKSAMITPPQFRAPAITYQPPAQAITQAPKANKYVSTYDAAPTGTNAAGIPRAWIPAAKANQYYWIIIHHTATPAGNMARIDASHRAKGWDCVGYDFIVGNGTESKDGQVEVGPRWTRQMVGAHTQSPDGSNKYNKHGIGIVMVGNFDETKPSAKQMQATAQLVAYLMKTYKVPADRVWGHRNAKATDCPGKFTDVLAIRRMATKQLADAGDVIPTVHYAMNAEDPNSPVASARSLPTGELLRDTADITPAMPPIATGE